MAKLAHRKFYHFDFCRNSDPGSEVDYKTRDDKNKLFTYVSNNVIGNNTVFTSPFGPRKVLYCDYTASGRSLKFIENYILDEVLPHYGSTHTTTSVTSLQTTLFRHEARDIVRNAVRASEHDRIIFIGSGATGAFHKLLHGLRLGSEVIFFTDFVAHHSSFLPLRDLGATVIRVKETQDGIIDLLHLETLLATYQGKQMIGCFSAASNITGIIADDVIVTKLLHKYGALAFWDYATAAPYVDIAMNPVLVDDPEGLAYKDAVYFSLHKFLGGVQTPGVLVVKEKLWKNEVPSESGGGTIFFVSQESHRYLKDIEEREEAGTPPIVETIRGGLVMQLKMNLTHSAIMDRCHKLSEKLLELTCRVPEITPLGNMQWRPRLPILSFLVQHHKSKKFLHYNFVSAVLNDVFGIQSRGGCACAGPYALDLLGIDQNLAKQFEETLMEEPSLDRSHLRRKEEHGNLEILRPGFVRINLPYTASEDEINFILIAIEKVCKDGWKLLPQYVFNPETGEWKHYSNLVFKHRHWLQNISYSDGSFLANVAPSPNFDFCLNTTLAESDQIFEKAAKLSQKMKVVDESLLFNENMNHLVWFLGPSEAKRFLSDPHLLPVSESHIVLPFSPPLYPLDEELLQKRPLYIWTKTNKHKESSQQSGADSTFSKQSGQVFTSDIVGMKDDGTYSCDNNRCSNNIRLSSNTQIQHFSPLPHNRWVTPSKNIFNLTTNAIQYFDMIHSGDKVLICLSGGKDSLSLLHTLHQYQFYAKSKGMTFSLGAITVDPESSSYDPTPLIPYLSSLNMPYLFEKQGILKQAAQVEDLNSICSFCSRMKRGRFYAAARRGGFNVLALGQHLDDVSESFLMSAFRNGRLRTMKASYTVSEGDLRVIRPFVFVREKDLRYFAESNKLPIIPENCPGCFDTPKERHRVKQLLAQQEAIFPHLFWSLKTALLPLLSIKVTGVENILFGKQLPKNCTEK